MKLGAMKQRSLTALAKAGEVPADLLCVYTREERQVASVAKERRVTATEAAFLLRAKRHGNKAKTIRNGWPDFMIVGFRPYCVEVKADVGDALRPSQRALFPHLEACGIRVYVWSPDRPERLVPWRKWRSGQQERSGRKSTSEADSSSQR